MRQAAAAILVAATLLAGCLGGDRGGDGPPPAASTSTGTSASASPTQAPQPPLQVLDLLLAFEFTGCSGLSVLHERPLDDVQALLPPGFTAAPGPGGVSAATGVLAVDLFRCGNLTTAAVTVPDTYVGFVYTHIERPVDRVPGAPDSPVQEYVFRVLSATDVLATLWPAAGYDTYSAPANVTVGPAADSPDPLLRLGTGTVGDGPGSEYLLVASGLSVAALPAARTQPFARYTVHAGDGSVLLWTGTYDFPAAAVGSGTVEVPASDPFAVYAPPEGRLFPGAASQFDGGAVRGQDLRRLFIPAA